MAVAHATVLLRDEPNAAVVHADLRDTDDVPCRRACHRLTFRSRARYSGYVAVGRTPGRDPCPCEGGWRP